VDNKRREPSLRAQFKAVTALTTGREAIQIDRQYGKFTGLPRAPALFKPLTSTALAMTVRQGWSLSDS
jgi:hypothetical protein